MSQSDIRLNRMESSSASDAPETSAINFRPSKRYQALLLISGFMMTFQVIGINTTYGIYQEFYTSADTNIADAQGKDAIVSFIGAVGTGLTWSGSIFVSAMMAQIAEIRYITIGGTLIMSLGILGAAFCTQIWQLFITQALLYGVGASMLYFPIMSITPMYFDKHRAFAMGFILAGSGVGGLVYAPLLRYLISSVGVQWTLRISSIINLVVCIPTACVIKRVSNPHLVGRTMISANMIQRASFWYQAFGAFLQAAGNVVPVYYLTTFSTSVLSLSVTTASLLLAVNNGVNSASRVAMGALADKFGRQNTMCLSVLISGVTVFALWYNAKLDGLIAFTVLYGIYAGGYNALLPVVLGEVYGTQNYASVNSMLYFIRGLGAIAGAPLAGVILGSHSRGASASMHYENVDPRDRYNKVAIYDGTLLLAAGFCVCVVRWLDARDKGSWKWRA